MLNTSFTPWPNYTQEEADAVSSVLLSNKVNYWTGNEGKEFEKEFADFCNVKYAVAVMNGTVALDLALIALGIGENDEVIVTPRTFLASASAIISVGAIPIFADVDLNSQNITANSIKVVLTPNTKAIICVHLSGWPCEMDDIMKLADANNISVIEDCAQAHGAKYKGKPVGSIGHVAAWSFCQDKIMTTGGEGGMVTTNSEEIYHKIWSYKDHGKSQAAITQAKESPGFNFKWLHGTFGTNFRMTEMQATIGRIQLRKMTHWHKERTNSAQRILQTAKKITALITPQIPNHIEHGWYKCYVRIKNNLERSTVLKTFADNNIPCYSGICPEVYNEGAFSESRFKPVKPLDNAHALGKDSLMFLVHPGLTDEEIESVCNLLNKTFRNKT